MENYYNKTKSLAIIALIIVAILFIWDAVRLLESLISILKHFDDITRFYTIRNFISSIARLIFSFGSVIVLNIMILTRQKNKTYMLVALALVLVIVALLAVGSLNVFIDSLYLIIKNHTTFLKVFISLILFALKTILFLVTLYEFLPYVNLIKEETAN